MPSEYLNHETLAMGLAGLAAFAGVVSLAMPGRNDTRLMARLRLVAHERRHMRERRLEQLSMQTKERLKRDADTLLKQLITLKTTFWGYNEENTARLRMAGLRGEGPEAVFLLLQAALPVVFFSLTFAVLVLWPGGKFSMFLSLQFAFATGIGGYALPGVVLGRLIARRQRAITRVFPDALDLLLICVQSGMSVEAALARVTKEISGQSVELAEELSLTMAELAYHPSRWRAYQNLGDRTGLPMVKMIASALTQAERYGTSISQALTATAKECRDAQIAEAERKAAALPPKLTVPLVVFFLPVVMVIILAPAAISTQKALESSGGHLMGHTAPQPDASPKPAGRARPANGTERLPSPHASSGNGG